jgi:hypothetical protein
VRSIVTPCHDLIANRTKSKDIKRACAYYIEPFVVTNGPFYRGSSRLGSGLHSEGLKVSPNELL